MLLFYKVYWQMFLLKPTVYLLHLSDNIKTNQH